MGIIIRVRARLWPRMARAINWAMPSPMRNSRFTARLINAVPRAYGVAHPRWWHVSLKVQPDGLVSDEVSLPDGRALRFKLDLLRHEIVLTVDGEKVRSYSMMEGRSATALADDLLGRVADLGLDGPYDRA